QATARGGLARRPDEPVPRQQRALVSDGEASAALHAAQPPQRRAAGRGVLPAEAARSAGPRRTAGAGLADAGVAVGVGGAPGGDGAAVARRVGAAAIDI